jgi:DRG Family Regulatory Proteins, Tma46
LDKFEADQHAKREAKKQEEEEKKFMAELYGQGIAASSKVAAEVEATTGGKKVCPFFKAGVCDKGRRCKFSHEMGDDEKAKTLNIYMDPRDAQKNDGGDEDGGDNINKWDKKKLEEVVNFNAKKYDNINKPTDIVCKNFLDAIEKKIYGWFWVCPNGGYKCIYRHALPQGYILKSDMDGMKINNDDKGRIEDLIDNEIYNLDKKTLTPLTHDRFLDWKRKRMEKKQKENDERLKQDLLKAGHKGKLSKVLTGKSMFVYQPE